MRPYWSGQATEDCLNSVGSLPASQKEMNPRGGFLESDRRAGAERERGVTGVARLPELAGAGLRAGGPKISPDCDSVAAHLSQGCSLAFSHRLNS